MENKDIVSHLYDMLSFVKSSQGNMLRPCTSDSRKDIDRLHKLINLYTDDCEFCNNDSVVNIDSYFKIRVSYGDGEEEEEVYRLSSDHGGDIDNGIRSVSAVGALGFSVIGKSIGDTFSFEAPNGIKVTGSVVSFSKSLEDFNNMTMKLKKD